MGDKHGKGRPYRRGGNFGDDRKKRPPKPSSSDSPILQLFGGFQQALDCRYDKHERVFKLSRDITTASKRIIFSLHRHNSQSDSTTNVFEESTQKLTALGTEKWIEIAKELENEDPYQFLRAYSPGLQEYIEAVSFHHYLQHKSLITLERVQELLTFDVKADNTDLDEHQGGGQGNPSSDPGQLSGDPKGEPSGDPFDLTGDRKGEPSGGPCDLTSDPKGEPCDLTGDPKGSESSNTDESNRSLTQSSVKQLKIVVPPSEYMQGIADLTGELMRMAINYVGGGNLQKPFELCGFLRNVFDHMRAVNGLPREMHKKVSVFKQSLVKVERACYTLQVRSSEIPEHMLKIFTDDEFENTDGAFEFY